MPSHVELKAQISFEKLNAFIASQFEPIEVNDKLKIHTLKVGGEGRVIHVHAEVTGAYDGPVVIRFIPNVGKASRSITLDDLEIKIESKNLFARGANFFANKVFGGAIDKKFEEIINQQFTQMMNEWIKRLAHFELPGGFVLKLSEIELDIQNIRSVEDALYCLVLIDANSELVL